MQVAYTYLRGWVAHISTLIHKHPTWRAQNYILRYSRKRRFLNPQKWWKIMFFFIRQQCATLELSFWLLPPPAEKHDLNHNYQSSSFQHAWFPRVATDPCVYKSCITYDDVCVCRKLVKSPHDERSLVGRFPIVLKLLRPPCSPHLRSAEASSVPQKKGRRNHVSSRWWIC